MDHEFDAALRALAEAQLRHGIRAVVLSIQQPVGDIVASVLNDKGTRVLYARIDATTKTMTRLRS